MPVEITGVREIDVSDLTPLPGNPRRGNVTEIRRSVARLGQYRTVVVRDTGAALVILAGNHTVQALAAEGRESVRCEVIRCTDDEARRVAAADNRLGELPDPETGERYDDESLAELLASLDGDYDGTGWTGEDLTEILRGAAEAASHGDGTGGGDVPDSADLPNDGEDRYREQYGVIVICDGETDQQQAYEELTARGYNCRVVTT